MGRAAHWVLAVGIGTVGALAAAGFGWFAPERVSALVKISTESAAPVDWPVAAERVKTADVRQLVRMDVPDQADQPPRVRQPVHAPPSREVKPSQAAPVPAAPIHSVLPREPDRDRVIFVKPRDDAARRKLAQAIQTELKRVGCFGSDVDGVWNEGTRRAMRTFTERINATLPVDEPDYILLTLVQGQKERACGKACPPGQVAVGEDRCEPRAIVAQKNERAARVQQEAQIRKARVEAERQARKPMANPPVVPVAVLPSPPPKDPDIPLRAPPTAAPAPLPSAPPLQVVAVVPAEPVLAETPPPEVRKPAPQMAGRTKPRPTQRRNIGGFAPASALGRLSKPPRVVAIRRTGSGVRSAPFASLARSAP